MMWDLPRNFTAIRDESTIRIRPRGARIDGRGRALSYGAHTGRMDAVNTIRSGSLAKTETSRQIRV
jgi:hypothetical protein